jgi:hypothetical protein
MLDVRKSGRPADDVVACLAPVALFMSAEDATDTTPALGGDLGVGVGPASQHTCLTAIAAVRTAPGVYRFTWEPDTPGRINLQFAVGDSRLNVPVDVGNAPADSSVLIGFVLLIGAILGAAAWIRHNRRQQGGAV